MLSQPKRCLYQFPQCKNVRTILLTTIRLGHLSRPESVHTRQERPGLPAYSSTPLGLTKMPLPTMMPMIMAAPSTSLSSRRSFGPRPSASPPPSPATIGTSSEAAADPFFILTIILEFSWNFLQKRHGNVQLVNSSFCFL